MQYHSSAPPQFMHGSHQQFMPSSGQYPFNPQTAANSAVIYSNTNKLGNNFDTNATPQPSTAYADATMTGNSLLPSSVPVGPMTVNLTLPTSITPSVAQRGKPPSSMSSAPASLAQPIIAASVKPISAKAGASTNASLPPRALPQPSAKTPPTQISAHVSQQGQRQPPTLVGLMTLPGPAIEPSIGQHSVAPAMQKNDKSDESGAVPAGGDEIIVNRCFKCGETTHYIGECDTFKMTLCSHYLRGLKTKQPKLGCRHENSADCPRAHGLNEVRKYALTLECERCHGKHATVMCRKKDYVKPEPYCGNCDNDDHWYNECSQRWCTVCDNDHHWTNRCPRCRDCASWTHTKCPHMVVREQVFRGGL
jgi:hypothetical protein